MKRLSMILALVSIFSVSAVAEDTTPAGTSAPAAAASAAPAAAPAPGTNGGLNQTLPNPNWQNFRAGSGSRPGVASESKKKRLKARRAAKNRARKAHAKAKKRHTERHH